LKIQDINSAETQKNAVKQFRKYGILRFVTTCLLLFTMSVTAEGVPAAPPIIVRVRGGNSQNTPYTSTTDPNAPNSEPKIYGKDEVQIDTGRLQRDIDSGKVQGTEIVTSSQVRQELQGKVEDAQKRYDANPTRDNLSALQRAQGDLSNATRDGECLIRGCVPAPYISPVRPATPTRPPATPQPSSPVPAIAVGVGATTVTPAAPATPTPPPPPLDDGDEP
jgi:hypothetical protein